MKYLLMVSVVVNILLIAKIVAMRLSVKELREDFACRADLESNTLIGVSSRDKQIRILAKERNPGKTARCLQHLPSRRCGS